jgi:hypothetical protein
MRFRYWLVFCLLPQFGLSQPLAFGVKAGAPISPESQSDPYRPFVCVQSAAGPICGGNEFFAKPYAVGPTAEAFLPWNFSVEADVLYRRFHKDISEGLVVGRGSGFVSFGRRAGVAADAWLFPLLLKYSFASRKLAPFATAGATLRHLGTFNGRGLQLDFFLRPQPQSFHFETGRDLDVAITAGAGVRWSLVFFDISPEIRFLHWTSTYYQPAPNQAMFMLGITFPARKR